MRKLGGRVGKPEAREEAFHIGAVESNRVKAETCLPDLRAWDSQGPQQELIRWDTGETDEECAGGKETQDMGSTLSGNLAVR